MLTQKWAKIQYSKSSLLLKKRAILKKCYSNSRQLNKRIKQFNNIHFKNEIKFKKTIDIKKYKLERLFRYTT